MRQIVLYKGNQLVFQDNLWHETTFLGALRVVLSPRCSSICAHYSTNITVYTCINAMSWNIYLNYHLSSMYMFNWMSQKTQTNGNKTIQLVSLIASVACCTKSINYCWFIYRQTLVNTLKMASMLKNVINTEILLINMYYR